jgi:uncharacterized membrane protein
MRSRLFYLAAGTVAAGVAAAAVTTAAGQAGAAPARPSAEPPACTYRLDTRLPLPTGFSNADLQGADRSGTLFIGSATHREVDDTSRAVLWRNGQATLLPTPTGFSSTAIGVNARGDVVGLIAKDLAVPVLWRNGRMIELTHDPKVGARAEAINAAGQIVGTQDAGTDTESTGLVWTVNAPTASRPIPVAPGYGWGSAKTLGDTGDLVADIFPLDPATQDVIGVGSVNGVRPVAGPPDSVGTVDAHDSAGAFIAGDEFVTGEIDLEERAVRWKSGEPTVLSKVASRAFGVNSTGTVAGFDESNGPQAVVWTAAGTQLQLPVITTGPAATGSLAFTMAENGAVGGNLVTPQGDRPVVWHCV